MAEVSEVKSLIEERGMIAQGDNLDALERAGNLFGPMRGPENYRKIKTKRTKE